MSGRAAEAAFEVRAPRETTVLFGHEAAEAALLAAYRSGRIPHAWLLGGPQGIGKATLAYRMARFALAHPDPAAPEVQAATSLAVDADHPVARRVAGGSHGSLLTLERSANEKGVKRTVITVAETRETTAFFGSTAAAEGWRVCIVDTVDELNANAANALLKILEEPPQRALFLLVSHAPARLLPTILSRCRRLPLRALSPDDVARAVVAATDNAVDRAGLDEIAEAAEGSVARALTLLGGDALGLHQRTRALLDQLPQIDQKALHALGDALAGYDRVAIAAFMDTVDRWMGDRLKTADANANLPRLARLAEVWEKVTHAARDTEAFNLERKPLVFSVFGLLADVAR